MKSGKDLSFEDINNDPKVREVHRLLGIPDDEPMIEQGFPEEEDYDVTQTRPEPGAKTP